MSFSIDIVQKRLVSPVDVLEEIKLKESKGYQLIGILKRREEISEAQWENVLTGPKETELLRDEKNTWRPMRRMLNRLASQGRYPAYQGICNHFHITMSDESDHVLGWVFVLRDKGHQELIQTRGYQQHLLGEWTLMQLWLHQSWAARALMNPPSTRTEINELIHKPFDDFHQEDPLLHHALYPFMVETMLDSVARSMNVWGGTLIGVLQVNSVRNDMLYVTQELARLINTFSATLKCKCLSRRPSNNYNQYYHIGVNEISHKTSVCVDYVLIYADTSVDAVDEINMTINKMRQSLSLDWLFLSRFVKLGITNPETVALMKDKDLFQLHPNIIDDSEEGVSGEMDLGENTLTEDERKAWDTINNVLYHPRPDTENILTKSQKKDIRSVLTFS